MVGPLPKIALGGMVALAGRRRAAVEPGGLGIGRGEFRRDPARVSGDQAQIGGLLIAVAGLAIPGARWLQEQLRGAESPRDAAEMLAQRVRQAEQASRFALLGKTKAANLYFTADKREPHDQAHAVIGPPTVWADEVRSAVEGFGELPLRDSIASAFGAAVVFLLPVWGAWAFAWRWPVPSMPARVTLPTRTRFAVGLAGWLALGLVGWFIFGPAGGLTFGLAGGLVVWSAVLIRGGRQAWDFDADVGSPLEPLRMEFVKGVLNWSAMGLAFAFAVWLTGGLTLWFAVGFTIWLVLWSMISVRMGIPGGLTVWSRYVLGVGLDAANGKLPWRLGSFLDWACAAGLLRIAGGAYQFRHLELQRWLAEQQLKPAASRQ